jgi:hypothetical protein
MVGRIERLARPTGYQPQMGPFKFNEGLLKGSKTLYVAVGSGPLQLDIVAEALCDSAASAEGIAKTLQGILEILRAVPPQPSDPSNAEFGAFLAGVTVQQAQESVFVRWQGNLEMLSFLERLVP